MYAQDESLTFTLFACIALNWHAESRLQLLPASLTCPSALCQSSSSIENVAAMQTFVEHHPQPSQGVGKFPSPKLHASSTAAATM